MSHARISSLNQLAAPQNSFNHFQPEYKNFNHNQNAFVLHTQPSYGQVMNNMNNNKYHGMDQDSQPQMYVQNDNNGIYQYPLEHMVCYLYLICI